MVPYYILFTFFGILSFIEHCKIEKLQLDFWVVISFLVLLYFYGFRYDVGIDWYSYFEFYNRVEPISLILKGKTFAPNFYSPGPNSMEIGYRILNSVLKSMGVGFQLLIFTIALFNLTSLYSFLFNQKIKYKFTLVTIFISLAMFREFDIFRQSISFYIFLYSLKYLHTDLKKYILINFLGCLFHLSSIILILIFPLLKIKFSKSSLIIVFILYLVTFFVAIPFIGTIINIMEPMQILSPFMVKIFAFYKYLNFPKSFGLTISLPCIILMLILIIKYNTYDQFDQNYRTLANLFVCYLFVSIFGSEIAEVVNRIGYYFFIGIAAISSLLPLFLNSKFKYTIAIFPMLFILIKFTLMMNTSATKISYTPYTNYIFSSSENREKRIFIKQKEVSDYYLDKISK